MGVWGTGIFDNDVAADWMYELEERGDMALIEETLDRIQAESDDYIDADMACQALAAIETLTRLMGHGGARTPASEPIDHWVAENNANAGVPQWIARAAVDIIERVLGPSSELNERWAESDAYESWQATLIDLRRRVGP